MFGLFKSKKKLQVRNPKADAEFLEAKKKIDDYILLKLKETREHFFFNDVMATEVYRKLVFKNDLESETYILDKEKEQKTWINSKKDAEKGWH